MTTVDRAVGCVLKLCGLAFLCYLAGYVAARWWLTGGL